MSGETVEMGKGLMEGLIAALSDKHSQIDLRLEGLTVDMGDSRLAVHVNGTLSVAVHMRDLTPDEKAAHASANIARIQATA